MPTSELASTVFQGNAHVLVAEDNLMNQEVVRGFLEKLGCQVTLVATGQDAYDISGARPFDLIFMDCQMPEMDGYEAVKAILAREASAPGKPHVPIIAMTAHALEGDREKCLAAGMDDYIGKPFSVEQLRIMLARWLPLQRREKPAQETAGTEEPSEKRAGGLSRGRRLQARASACNGQRARGARRHRRRRGAG